MAVRNTFKCSACCVSYREETNTGDNDSTDMVPAKRSLVNLSKSETSPLVRVRNMGVVVVEVVEGSIASLSSECHSE